ncbi:MAG: LysM peptidoglycan-binding domain-containing protein [Dermatophilus congolensis]|nr:LysM peptidoglycan-binding domain-containing protein [Dermatophilus congolensis]
MNILPLVTAAAVATGAPTVSMAPSAVAPSSNVAAVSVATAATKTYRVRSGDTMSHIAVRFDVSLSSLLRANGMTMSSKIRPGQKITIPGRSESTGRSAYDAEKAKSHEAKARATGRHKNRDIIVATARRYGVDPHLALAIGWQESRWNQNARSHKGAIGVMQCLPGTGQWMSQRIGRTLDLNDTRDNITCGVALIKTLSKSAKNDRELIAAYYQGMASVRKIGMYDDTKRYVASVVKHRNDM